MTQQLESSGLTDEEMGNIANRVSKTWSSCTIDRLTGSAYPESERLIDLLAASASMDAIVRVFDEAEENDQDAFLSFYRTQSLACFYAAAQENGVVL